MKISLYESLFLGLSHTPIRLWMSPDLLSYCSSKIAISRVTASTRQDSGCCLLLQDAQDLCERCAGGGKCPSRTLEARNVLPIWCSYQHRKSPACDARLQIIFSHTECGASSPASHLRVTLLRVWAVYYKQIRKSE